jgi:hypothetical protein
MRAWESRNGSNRSTPHLDMGLGDGATENWADRPDTDVNRPLSRSVPSGRTCFMKSDSRLSPFDPSGRNSFDATPSSIRFPRHTEDDPQLAELCAALPGDTNCLLEY